MSAEETWTSLEAPWRIAFEEAWTSWCGGNFGIGAVLVDPATTDADGDPEVVCAGRNRVSEKPTHAATIAGNFMAHAEMNAYAALPRFTAEGLHLYTTLEPCLMCAATTIMLNVSHVNFAVADEFFEGLDDLWSHHPYPAGRQPTSDAPLHGKIVSFARVLPMSFTLLFNPEDHPVVVRARTAAPAIADLAARLPNHTALNAVDPTSALDALTALWNDLPDPQ